MSLRCDKINEEFMCKYAPNFNNVNHRGFINMNVIVGISGPRGDYCSEACPVHAVGKKKSRGQRHRRAWPTATSVWTQKVSSATAISLGLPSTRILAMPRCLGHGRPQGARDRQGAPAG